MNIKLTKEEIQERVLKDGKPLNLNLFSWDENGRTFSSNESGLFLDFNGINKCTFKTGYNCTFDAGSDCTFKTGADCTFDAGLNCTFKTGADCTFDAGLNCTFDAGSDCTFKTGLNCTFKTGADCTFDAGSDCTFNTGSDCTFKTGLNCTFNTGSYCTFDTGYACTFDTGHNCTFKTGPDCTFDTGHNCTFKTGSDCVVVRRDVFEVILLKENIETMICPYNIKGYLEKINNKFIYSEDSNKENEYIIIDNILSKVISRKRNVLKVQNYNETKESYIIQDGDLYSHGETIKEARDSLVYKISSRDTSMYKDLTLNSILSKDECIKMYRVITGACESGTKYFVSKQEPSKIKNSYSIKELIELTEGQFGNLELKKYFKF